MKTLGKAILVIFGLALLVPGMCSIVTLVGAGPNFLITLINTEEYTIAYLASLGSLVVIWLLGILLGWGGITLIRYALRKQP